MTQMTKKDKGLLIVNTGDGKGKTTSALGVALRTIGYGGTVYLLYFMKEIKTSEARALKRFGDQMVIEQAGAGFYKIRGDHSTEDEHRKMAAEAIKRATDALKSGKYDLVIFDEILNSVDVGLMSNAELLKLVAVRGNTDVIVTGRNARKGLISRADLVSDVNKVKHPFDKGIYAKKGIDF